jgi:uncharacterized membrane-anchored protein
VPAGAAGIGIVLSIALSNIIILPISLVVVGGFIIALRSMKKAKARLNSAPP